MPVDYRVDIKSSRICNGKVLTESVSRQESMAMELSSPGGPEREEKMRSKSFLWRRLCVKSTHMQAVAFKGFPVKKLSCFWQQPNGVWKGNGVCQTAGAGKREAGLLVLMRSLRSSRQVSFRSPPKGRCQHSPVEPGQLSCATWVPNADHSSSASWLFHNISASWCWWCAGAGEWEAAKQIHLLVTWDLLASSAHSSLSRGT